jgi:hypothetical protein
MRTPFAIFAMSAAACTGDAFSKDSGTTESGTGFCTATSDDPPTIDVATVDCNGNQVSFFVETTNWTDDGVVFTQETGNPETQWSDEHDLLSVEWDECGFWDRLRLTLNDASTLDDPLYDWQQNVSTVFDCSLHYGDPNVITYAFAVYDGNQVADCIVFGHDPQGMINGNYRRVNQPSFNLSQCTLGQNTMAR